MNTQEFALTYPQLMNQAIRQKLTEGELFRLRRAYDLTEELVDGFYRAQSVPFICHLVRTASIVLAEGQPIHVVIAALLHAAYTFGQFEDGICGKATTAHRRKLEQVIGSEAESLVYAYDPFLLHGPEVLETHLKRCETYRDISNCVVINGSAFPESYSSEKIEQLRKKVDEVMSDRIKKTFYESQRLRISNSGHFLYPSGGFMGWHTNREAPGWRLYINYCEEPGKSFFRYRDPETGQIRTLWDDLWNFRLFKIDPKVPFWHAVYSETNRYSFGFRITLSTRPPFLKRAVDCVKQLTKGNPLARS